MKNGLRPLLFYGGLPFLKIAWSRVAGKQRVFILFYHKINIQAPPLFGVAVKPKDFERQIRFLKRFFQIVDLPSLSQAKLEPYASRDLAIITFDDGYRDNYNYAFPVLKKYNIPATIFLVTDYVDTNQLLDHDKLSWILYKCNSHPNTKVLKASELPEQMVVGVQRFFASNTHDKVHILRSLAAVLKELPEKKRQYTLTELSRACAVREWPGTEDRVMLSWAEVREMSHHGISFGSHTMSHPVLSAIPTLEAQKEMIESRKTIEAQIQQPVTTFAYPYGKEGDYTHQVVKLVEDAGFEYACTTTAGHEQIPPETPLVLKRRGVPPHPYLLL